MAGCGLAGVEGRRSLHGGCIQHLAAEAQGLSRMMKKGSCERLPDRTESRLNVSSYARPRHPTKHDVQLSVAGAASARGSSLAANSADGGYCLEGALSDL